MRAVVMHEPGNVNVEEMPMPTILEPTDAIIKLAKDLGIEVREQVLSRESLYLADEVFMSGTAAEITPVRSVDGIQVGEGRCGPVTKRIQQAFFGLFTGETEDKYCWLDQVNH